MESSETDCLLPPNPESVPRDRLKLVYVIFYLLGIGTLLPWNFFSNARLYFMYKLRNTSLTYEEPYRYDPEHSTELQIMFENYLSVAAMLPGVLFMFLNTAATKLIKLRIRMVGAAIVMILMFTLTVILVKINTDDWQVRFFAVTLVSIVIMNAGSAVLQGGIFGLSSMFPCNYTQSVMGGMGMGGTMAAVANLLATWLSYNPLDMGFGYFLTAESVIIIALIGYCMLPMLKFARYHQRSSTRSGSTTVNAKDGVEQEEEEVPVRVKVNENIPLVPVFKKIWVYGLSVFFIFMVTLSCYPAINSSIRSVNAGKGKSGGEWANTYFSPTTCFLFFNVGDLIGRTIAGWFQWPRDGSKLIPLFALLRVVFVPLFLLCNVQPRKHLPVIFDSDIAPMVLMWVFALSNGYLGTLCMMYGPRRVHKEDVETAGSMMSFFLSSGLAAGSLLSFLLIKLV